MPIFSRSRARIMPPNHGSVEVAATTLQDLIPAQRLRYHNAFKVNSYHGILYHALNSGVPCHCRGRGTTLSSRLNEDGSAKAGFLNEMLTGGDQFGAMTADPMFPTSHAVNRMLMLTQG